MKKQTSRIVVLFICTVFLVMPGIGGAEEKEDPIHEKLRALNARIVEAFNKRDVDAILAEVHENIVFTTMNNDVVRGRENIRAYFEKMMVGPERVVDDIKLSFVPDALTVLYHGNTGIATGDSVGKFKMVGGLIFEVQTRWTATIIRTGTLWQVAGFHYSANMFDNPILNDVTQTYKIIGGGVALFTLLLGVIIGRKTKK
jgi:ketosteroid isomerase-like protein